MKTFKLNVTLEITVLEGGYYSGLEQDIVDELLDNVPLQSYFEDPKGDQVIVDIEHIELTNNSQG